MKKAPRLILKSHISGYVKKDGTYVVAHEDKRHPAHVADLAAKKSGGNIVGNAIPKNIVGRRGINLVDRGFKNPGELAAMAQIFRNPLYETFRVFFEKDGRIVGQTGISARLPGTTMLPHDMDSLINQQAKNLNANGVWLMHNHPSGDPTPSPADKQFTSHLALSVPLLKGHVIINSGRYSFIDRQGGHVMNDLPINPFGGGILDPDDGQDLITYDLENHGDFSRKHGWLLAPFYSEPMRLAITEKYMQKHSNKCVMFSVGGTDSQIRAVVEYPVDQLSNPAVQVDILGNHPQHVKNRIAEDKFMRRSHTVIALIHLITQQTGGSSGNILVCDSDNLAHLDWLYDSGAVRDIISMSPDGVWRSYEYEDKPKNAGNNKFFPTLNMQSKIVEQFVGRK
jgi:proteasome lid subunit RPN8/RPN11